MNTMGTGALDEGGSLNVRIQYINIITMLLCITTTYIDF